MTSSFKENVQVRLPEWCSDLSYEAAGSVEVFVTAKSIGFISTELKTCHTTSLYVSSQLHLQDFTIMLESCSTLGVRPE